MCHLPGIQGECGLIHVVPGLLRHVIYPRHVFVELVKQLIDQGHVVRLCLHVLGSFLPELLR